VISIKGIGKMKKNFLLKAILWIVQGFIVGLGAILPGVSGGTLCYAFGIYDQILEVLSNPFKGIKKHFKMLVFVGIGGVLGFVGFAEFYILVPNFQVVAICFVLYTLFNVGRHKSI
jgi:putative membrane protein